MHTRFSGIHVLSESHSTVQLYQVLVLYHVQQDESTGTSCMSYIQNCTTCTVLVLHAIQRFVYKFYSAKIWKYMYNCTRVPVTLCYVWAIFTNHTTSIPFLGDSRPNVSVKTSYETYSRDTDYGSAEIARHLLIFPKLRLRKTQEARLELLQ
jgi:hypothetical protein